MAGTNLFDFVDTLLAIIAALPECASPVAVFDGITAPNMPDTFVLVGATAEGTRPLTDDQQWTAIGARKRDEDLEVPVTVSAAVGGSNSPGGNDAQKTARDKVKTVVQAIENALRADVTLKNGTNQPLVFWCEVAQVSLRQTDPDTAAAGRGATVDLTIRARARI